MVLLFFNKLLLSGGEGRQQHSRNQLWVKSYRLSGYQGHLDINQRQLSVNHAGIGSASEAIHFHWSRHGYLSFCWLMAECGKQNQRVTTCFACKVLRKIYCRRASSAVTTELGVRTKSAAGLKVNSLLYDTFSLYSCSVLCTANELFLVH